MGGTARGLFDVRVGSGGQVLDVTQIDDTDQVSSHRPGRVRSSSSARYGLETQLGRLEGGRFSPRGRIPVFLVQHILEDEDGSLWLSTDEGVVHLRPTVFEEVRVADESLHRILVSFVQTADGAFYASDRRDVYRLRRGPRGMVATPLLDEPSPFLLGLRTDGRFVLPPTRRACSSSTGTDSCGACASRGRTPRISSRTGTALWMIRATDDGVVRVAPDGSQRYFGVGEGVPRRALALDRSPAGELVVATDDPDVLLLRYDADGDSFAGSRRTCPSNPALTSTSTTWRSTGGATTGSPPRRPPRGEGGPGSAGRDRPRRSFAGNPGGAVDDDGSIWFATGEGVVHLDPETGEHELFDEGDGLPSRVVGVRDLYPVREGG